MSDGWYGPDNYDPEFGFIGEPEPLSPFELEQDQLDADMLVIEELEWELMDYGPAEDVPPFVPQPAEPGSYQDIYDGPFDDDGLVL